MNIKKFKYLFYTFYRILLKKRIVIIRIVIAYIEPVFNVQDFYYVTVYAKFHALIFGGEKGDTDSFFMVYPYNKEKGFRLIAW